MGATASGVWWPSEFCQKLAGSGRFVIRYDHRDTGRSTSYPPGEIGYSIEDLADDAAEVLDDHGLDAAHLVGMSLGGFLAQLFALKYPQRTKSLTLIASERLADTDPELPGMEPSVLDHFSKAGDVDWTDREQVVEHQVGIWRLISGSAHVFDETLIRQLAQGDYENTPNLATTLNHGLLQGDEKWLDRSDEIKVPTLIIHGTEDPVLPYANALALKEAITDSRLTTLEGTGHELHPDDWPTIIQAIERHTA